MPIEILPVGNDNDLPEATVEPNSSRKSTKINIQSHGGFIFIIYNQPVQFQKLTRQEAKEFARRLSKEALK